VDLYSGITTSLGPARRRELRQWLLPALYDAAPDEVTQELILRLFCTQGEERELVAEFVEQARRKGKLIKGKVDVKSGHVLATVKCALERVKGQALSDLLLVEIADTVFKGFTAQNLADFENDLARSCGNGEGLWRKRWRLMRERVEENNKAGPVKKIIKAIGGLFGRR
jgi:hypothetical protein